MSHTLLHALRSALCAGALFPAVAAAQLIPIKTLPIAQGDQFAFFPSANEAMGGVSIAVHDSMLDPFVNPAAGARLRAMRFFGSPSVYNISRSAGGGQTIPIGGLASSGSFFGGAVVAVQQVDPSHLNVTQFAACPGCQTLASAPNAASLQTQAQAAFPAPAQGQSKTNRYAFATVGRRLGAGTSIGGSVLYADLHRIDGVDQLYAGSQSVSQLGSDLDARLGIVRDWESGASVEALVVHDRMSMRHDVTFTDVFYNPNLRTLASRPRLERNFDRTDTWGVQVAWQRPVGDSGWRIGAFATGNLLSHPKLPDYQIVDIVRALPWDPGHSAAYNVGIGVAQKQGPSTFALDVVYEPIMTHTWGDAQTDITTTGGATILPGGKTTENHFTFSNVIARLGFAQDVAIGSAGTVLRVQGGVAAHAIRYWLYQQDHVDGTTLRQQEHWLESTPTWGASLRFASVDVRYVGRVTHGTGRPGIATAGPLLAFPDAASAGPSILAAPTGPLTLIPVSVTTHQLSIAVPLP